MTGTLNLNLSHFFRVCDYFKGEVVESLGICPLFSPYIFWRLNWIQVVRFGGQTDPSILSFSPKLVGFLFVCLFVFERNIQCVYAQHSVSILTSLDTKFEGWLCHTSAVQPGKDLQLCIGVNISGTGGYKSPHLSLCGPRGWMLWTLNQRARIWGWRGGPIARRHALRLQKTQAWLPAHR
jgi:hypothetical protein